MLLKFELKGQKKLFLVYGILNFLITNIILHITLLFLPTIIATVLSQTVNLLIGYYIYGKKVFKIENLNKFVFEKYFLLALSLWIFNFALIQSFFYIGVNKNITAIFIIPLLVVISYYFQRYFVFR
tara:strand:+ start:89 stop:466 length:378 start_codon:yes stop_codon:yes gene_type:complete